MLNMNSFQEFGTLIDICITSSPCFKGEFFSIFNS